MSNYRAIQTPEEMQIFLDNVVKASQEEKDLVNSFINRTITAEDFIDKDVPTLLMKLEYFVDGSPSLNAIIGSYEDYGIKAEPLKGGNWHTKTMVAIHHDGVQYSVDDGGLYFLDNDKQRIEHSLYHYQLLSTHYHERVKEVYDYLKTKMTDDIWAMSGGGSQLQVFFGNKDGYIGILYFDDDQYVKVGVENAKKAAIIANKKYTLVVQSAANNHYFENYANPNIKVRKSDTVR